MGKRYIEEEEEEEKRMKVGKDWGKKRKNREGDGRGGGEKVEEKRGRERERFGELSALFFSLCLADLYTMFWDLASILSNIRAYFSVIKWDSRIVEIVRFQWEKMCESELVIIEPQKEGYSLYMYVIVWWKEDGWFEDYVSSLLSV